MTRLSVKLCFFENEAKNAKILKIINETFIRPKQIFVTIWIFKIAVRFPDPEEQTCL